MGGGCGFGVSSRGDDKREKGAWGHSTERVEKAAAAAAAEMVAGNAGDAWAVAAAVAPGARVAAVAAAASGGTTALGAPLAGLSRTPNGGGNGCERECEFDYSGNVAPERLYPNTTSAEETSAANMIDILSNGFKLRHSNAQTNGNGNTYI